jgi:hypothetical protein
VTRKEYLKDVTAVKGYAVVLTKQGGVDYSPVSLNGFEVKFPTAYRSNHMVDEPLNTPPAKEMLKQATSLTSASGPNGPPFFILSFEQEVLQVDVPISGLINYAKHRRYNIGGKIHAVVGSLGGDAVILADSPSDETEVGLRKSIFDPPPILELPQDNRR